MNTSHNGRIRKKICLFCADTSIKIDYKDQQLLQGFITERSKIVPGRLSGACAFHQRELARAIKRARHIAILPYASTDL